MDNDYKIPVRERILSQDTFVRAVFSGHEKKSEVEWIKVVVRPVKIKDEINLQFSYFNEKKDITKNYTHKEAIAKVNELLAIPFKNIFVENISSNLQINISKKGKALISETKLKNIPATVNLTHNHQKARILTTDNAKTYLQAVGIMTNDGKIKPTMQKKYVQINEFIRIVAETDAFSSFEGQSIHVVDFGCGNAYLSFAIYYYLRYTLNLNVFVVGIDLKADLIEQHQNKAKNLGWDQLTFQVGHISSYHPKVIPDIVIALHACDTATDDAIAHGIKWNSKLIFCAPCCQHELQVQLSNKPIPKPLLPIFQHGLLFERMSDILTDTFRATILHIMGYRTDVMQFVPLEHTAKNLLIRSVKTSHTGNVRWVEEYKNLKEFWQVIPYLEQLLKDKYDYFQ